MKIGGFRRALLLLVPAIIGAGILLAANEPSANAETKTLDLASLDTAPRSEPFLAGVGVHFGIGGKYGYEVAPSALVIGDLKLNSYRDDLPWDIFDWPDPSYYTARKARVFDMMDQAHVRPLLIVGHPNPTVPGGNPPLTDEGRKAFAEYASRAAKETASHDPIYEIWNEWNMNAVQGQKWLRGPGEASDPRAAVNYVALARPTIDALRAAVPKATILVGAVGVDDGWAWTEGILKEGVLKGADGLSVHLYNHCEANRNDRNATQMINRLGDLQTMVSRFNGGKPFPIYVTEFGWPSVSPQCGAKAEDIPHNIAQLMLWTSAVPWVKGSWVYQLKDQGLKPDDMEDHFGLYDYAYKPKPAACAVGEAMRYISEGAPSAVERPFPNVFVLVQAMGDKRRVIAWTARSDVHAHVSVAGADATVGMPLCGDRISGADGLDIGPMPVVFELQDKAKINIRADAN
jgi:Cellulase (glycosyl hydrolase family 5)